MCNDPRVRRYKTLLKPVFTALIISVKRIWKMNRINSGVQLHAGVKYITCKYYLWWICGI